MVIESHERRLQWFSRLILYIYIFFFFHSVAVVGVNSPLYISKSIYAIVTKWTVMVFVAFEVVCIEPKIRHFGSVSLVFQFIFKRVIKVSK